MASFPRSGARTLYERLPTASVLDGSRAREVLGFEPTRNWRQMLAAAPASAAEA